MATIVNIFGKLYTFLRRPQPENEDQNQSTESTTQNANEDKQEASQQVENKEEGTKNGSVIVQKKDKLEKVMTDSAASSDWEHIPDQSSGKQQNTDGLTDTKSVMDDQLEIKPHLLNSSMGTDLDAVYSEDLEHNQQDEIPKDENQDGHAPADEAVDTKEKVSSKQEPEDEAGVAKCVGEETDVGAGKQNSGDLHKKGGQSESAGEKGQKDKKKGTDKMSTSEEMVVEEKPLKEEEFDNYLDFVSKCTDLQRQISAKNLFYKLGYMKDADIGIVGEAVCGQYHLAKSRNNWSWVKDARYFAELFFAPDWIDKNLPHKDQKSNRKNRPKKKEKFNLNEQYENPGGLCKDFRLKQNPDMQTVTTNAAGDSSNNNVVKSAPAGNIVASDGDVSRGNKTSAGKHENVDDFITDYTEQVIQEAMKMAIDDGLSESAIMEVIEDVTCSSRINTPHKRVQPAKVDLTRTPRSRPEQLALGFNYHSDLVVKQSPKTVKGEIIPLDTLPKPRERPEQLAVGFNYLAEQLVKESPKSETGEVIIPGVITTPRRLARDQLAIGFNYHSDLIAKDSPSKENVKANGISSEDLHDMNKKNDMVTLMNGIHNGYSDRSANEAGNKVKSAKRSISDTFAVGFSYNSDQVIKESLDELNGNVPNGHVVSSVIEDAVVCEGENIVEVIDEIPATGLPAGSVW